MRSQEPRGCLEVGGKQPLGILSAWLLPLGALSKRKRDVSLGAELVLPVFTSGRKLGSFPAGSGPDSRSTLHDPLCHGSSSCRAGHGNSFSEEMQQNMPGVQGPGHRFLEPFPPGQICTSSLEAGRRFWCEAQGHYLY